MFRASAQAAAIAGVLTVLVAGCSPSGEQAPTAMDEQDAAYKICGNPLECNFQPGRWETLGPTATVCSWYRMTGLAPEGKTIASGFIHQGGGRVELSSGDFFSFTGCQPFHFVKPGHE